MGNKKTQSPRPRIAILGSGGGSTAGAFIKAVSSGQVSAEVVLVVTDRPEKGLLERIEGLNQSLGTNIPVCEVSATTDPRRPTDPEERGITNAESERLVDLMREYQVDLIALMGYMRIIRGDILEAYGYIPGKHHSAYQARMINTHPGPLPETEDTYGLLTSEKVLRLAESGALDESRHSVHMVAAGVDKGPVIAATPVPIKRDENSKIQDSAESLFERVQLVEKAVLPYIIDRFLILQQEYNHATA